MSPFEAILNTNLINFIIVISTLVWIFKKFNLGSLIDNLKDDIKINVEKSSNSAKAALDEYKITKKSSKNIPILVDEIENKAKQNIENLKIKIEVETDLKQKSIINSFEKTKNMLLNKYKKTIIEDIYLSSVELAKNAAIERLDDETHKKLINSSIDELDNIEGSLL